MTREEQKARRVEIRLIVHKRKASWQRSVDDWWRIVGDDWPNGWNDAPSKATVKKVLQDMHYEGHLKWRFYVRGWFQQERFW